MSAPEIPEDADVSRLSVQSAEDHPFEEDGGSEDYVPPISDDQGGSW